MLMMDQYNISYKGISEDAAPTATNMMSGARESSDAKVTVAMYDPTFSRRAKRMNTGTAIIGWYNGLTGTTIASKAAAIAQKTRRTGRLHAIKLDP